MNHKDTKRLGGLAAWREPLDPVAVGTFPTATVVLFVVLLGFCLRVFRLDGQSIWGDEAIGIYHGLQSLVEISRVAVHEGNHPPLQYYLLHFWLPLAGSSEFSARFLSLIFGVLTIPVLYLAVRREFGQRAALLASLLAAISPFWVYYSQEARMYAQVTFFSLLSVYLFLRLTNPQSAIRNPKSLWFGYVLASALALFTYYFSGFVLLAQNLAYLGWLIKWRVAPGQSKIPNLSRANAKDLKSPILLWSGAQIGIILLILPWIIYAWQSLLATSGAVNRMAIPLSDILRHLLVTFSLGTSVEADAGLPVSLIFLALALLGIARTPRRAGFWLLYLIVPVLATYYISFVPYRGWARYFMIASPAWLALAANGLAALLPARSETSASFAVRARRAVRPVILIIVLSLILVASGFSLRGYYDDPRYARYDWRGAITRLEANAVPTDALIVNGPSWVPQVDYYDRQIIPRYDLPRPDLSGWERIEPELQRIAAAHTGVWLIKFHPPTFDPGGSLEGWLAQHGYRTSFEWVENASFSFYSLPQPGQAKIMPLATNFAGQIALTEARLALVTEKTGPLLQVTLFWQAKQPLDQDYTVFAHVVDGQGRLVAQRDSQPVGGYRPTRGWKVGEVVEDHLGILIPADRQGEKLRLRLGLYRPTDGRRLDILDGQGTAIGDYRELDLP